MKLHRLPKIVKATIAGITLALLILFSNPTSAQIVDEHANGTEQKLANQGMKKLEASANPLAGLRQTGGFRSLDASSSPDKVGQWSSIIEAPVVPVFSSLLPNGNVLMWDSVGDAPTESSPDQTFTRAAVWNPITNAFIRRDVSGFNIFCSGFSHLANGKLFVAGGNKNVALNGIRQTHIFNFSSNTWSRGADMEYERWYPSVASLPNGEQFVMAGGPDIHEVRQTNDTFRALTSAKLAHPRQYPFIQTSTDGRVFYAGPDPKMRLLNTAGQGQWQELGSRDSIYRSYGSYAMYDVGKFLVLGGSAPPTNTALTIDLTSGTPVVSATGSGKFSRRQHNLTVLPDGSVLATGGLSSNASLVDLNAGVFAAELWNPATGTWQELSSAAVTRQYHSVALLLPDGRVMTGGGGICDACQRNGYLRKDMEIFSPPYLFKPDGSGELATRPTITNAPSRIPYNNLFSISTPDASSVSKVALVKLGSPTHGVDMEQRYIPLNFTRGNGELNINSPANTNIAPPGYYMLFVVNNSGVPSVAKMVNVNPRTTFTSTIVAKHSNKCLDVPGGQNTERLQLQQLTCNDSDAQKFRFQLISSTNNTYQISNVQTGKCLDVYGSYTDDGNWVIQSSCNESSSQQFRLAGTGEGFYKLIATHSNRCVHVYGNFTEDRTGIIQFACDPIHPSQELAIDL